MFSRRTFLSLVAGSMAAPRLSFAQPASQKAALYANVGADLTHLSLSRLNHGLPRCQAHPEVMQGTTAFHHEMALQNCS